MQLFEKTLGDWLEYWAKETPDKEYIVYSDRNLRFTWKTFDERVNNMANGLLSIGVTRGTNVGIWAQNVPDWLTVLYATAKIGAVAVTVNTNYKTEELAFVLKNSDMHTLCLTEGIPGSDYIDMIYELLPELRTTQRGKLKSERFPETRNVVYIGQEKFRGMYNTAELLLVGANRPKDEFWSLRKQTNCMKFTPEDKCCVCVPLFHCFGVVLATMCCLTHGSTQVMVERFDPLLVLASIHKERCTVLHGVPTMFIAELNHPMFSLFDMGSLRTGIMAGSLCPIELMKQVNEKMFMDVTSVYGLTEASPGMTQTRVDDPFGVRCTTVGRAYEFTDVKVLDPATGIECPAGIEGEMCCRGYNVMKGYYKNPEATAQVIDANGYLHSGDLGVKDENGNYRITGRIKDMIIRGGENISPKEVEDFLYKMPEIKDVQVVAVASSRYGEDVGAFIILKDGKELTREDVRDFCKDHIARYKIPRYVFFINQFPMTGSGKIQKFRLRQLALEMCEADEIEII